MNTFERYYKIMLSTHWWSVASSFFEFLPADENNLSIGIGSFSIDRDSFPFEIESSSD